MKSKTSIRVLLADDHEIVREGLRNILEAEKRPPAGWRWNSQKNTIPPWS
jgi:DNA-binding NarL/FixJ family response regulator